MFIFKFQSAARQIVRQKNLLITLSFDDHIKIWNFKTGQLLNSILQENISATSKIVATENLLFWSSWGKIAVFDLSEIVFQTKSENIKELKVNGPVNDFELINNNLFIASDSSLKTTSSNSVL